MENLKVLLQIVEGKLHSVITLIAVLVFEVFFFVTVNDFISSFIEDSAIRGTIYIILLLGWIGFWFFNRFHLPRNDKKKQKIGIVIAIFSESEIERQKLKADFMSKLKEMLVQERISDFSEVFFLKNHFAEEIVESNKPVEKIKEFNKKISSHFYVWGRIKKRPNSNDAGKKYFLTFQGYVVHKPIPQELSSEIAVDFSAVLPREINFPEREFRGFEASAVIIHLAIKYIVGLAAFVSQNPSLAFRLHNGLREAFNAYKPLPAHLQNIRNKIPVLLSEESGWIARWHFQNNRPHEAKEFLSKSLSENNKNYGSWIFKAIMDFNDNNVQEAFKSIANAEKFSDGDCAWIYSKAFLYFWQSDYEKALKLCQKIKKQSQSGEELVCRDVRKFNLKILAINETKPQLYFWIGYLSYFKDQNLPQALEDFEKFEQLVGDSIPSLKSKSSAYLAEIKHKMKLLK
jgi:tetratricopeptide (TPR) repeat protein